MDKPFENTFDVKYDEKGIETFNRWQDPTINELQQQLDKYKNVINKIKEIVNKVDYDKWELQMTSIEKIMKIQELLEEVNG